MKGTIRSSSNNSQIKLGSSQYKKESCYILQDDRLNPLFTVNETMTMAADLKLGDSISPKAKQMLVSIAILLEFFIIPCNGSLVNIPRIPNYMY